MNNQDEAEFSYLMYEEGLRCEFVSNYGGPLETYSYEYTIFIPEIQRHLTGCQDLDDFDGVHQLDFDKYVGNGWTLKEAWDNFCGKVDIAEIEELTERVLTSE